jgi:hypothetical protein
MREIIQSVLATEAEAKRLVEEAQRHAGGTRAAARIRVAELIEQSHQQAKLEASRILSGAVEDAAKNQAAQLAHLRDRLTTEVRLQPAAREQIIQAAVAAICRTAANPERLSS